MKNIPVPLAVLLVAIGVAGGVVLSCYIPSPFGGHMMPGGKMMSQNVDQHFITEMIPHHEGAIAMAEIALTRSKRQEILSLARGIIDAQQKEITDMKLWYQSWFGALPIGIGAASGGHMHHMDSVDGDTGTLTSVADAEFDRAFITQMIPHHEMAVMMGRMLAASTGRNEMKQLADQIITSQSREIDMMRGWLGDWY